ISCIIFFFQAEDGIRYLTVTGVQTYALPISDLQRANSVGSPLARPDRLLLDRERRPAGLGVSPARGLLRLHLRERTSGEILTSRSEERRVGKECMWRG